jgi:hypothetical protein
MPYLDVGGNLSRNECKVLHVNFTSTNVVLFWDANDTSWLN